MGFLYKSPCNLFINFENNDSVYFGLLLYSHKGALLFSPKYEIYLLIYLGQFILSDQAKTFFGLLTPMPTNPTSEKDSSVSLGAWEEKRERRWTPSLPQLIRKYTACDE